LAAAARDELEPYVEESRRALRDFNDAEFFRPGRELVEEEGSGEVVAPEDDDEATVEVGMEIVSERLPKEHFWIRR